MYVHALHARVRGGGGQAGVRWQRPRVRARVRLRGCVHVQA